MKCISLLLLFLLILICMDNHISGYQNNEIPEFEPDDTQFMVCHNSLKDNEKVRGQNNYHMRRNKISEPLEGTYSNFIDLFYIRKMDNFYYSPICEKSYPSTKTNLNVYDRKILMEREDYAKEIKYDELELNDPFYVYGNPKYIQNKITYDNENLEKIFLDTRNHLIEDEEDYPTRVKYQRYFIDYPFS